MELTKDNLDLDILGFKIKVKAGDEDQAVMAREVANLVSSEAETLWSKTAHLDKGQVAILIALKFAEEKLKIEREYRSEIEALSKKADSIFEASENLGPELN